jgi:hypothetical protein
MEYENIVESENIAQTENESPPFNKWGVNPPESQPINFNDTLQFRAHSQLQLVLDNIIEENEHYMGSQEANSNISARNIIDSSVFRPSSHREF